MKLISVKLPEKYLEGLDTLVRIGAYRRYHKRNIIALEAYIKEVLQSPHEEDLI